MGLAEVFEHGGGPEPDTVAVTPVLPLGGVNEVCTELPLEPDAECDVVLPPPEG